MELGSDGVMGLNQRYAMIVYYDDEFLVFSLSMIFETEVLRRQSEKIRNISVRNQANLLILFILECVLISLNLSKERLHLAEYGY